MSREKKEEKRLRIGVIGCGPIAQFAHFDAIRKSRNAELYAICDLASDLVTRIQAVHEPRVSYSNVDDLLGDPQVEAVIIGVADPFHVPLCLQAIAAGKHVLVEKPLGISVEECEQLRQRVSKTQLTFQVGNNRRFDPGMSYAQRFVQKKIGTVMSFKAWYHDSNYRYAMTDNLQPIPYRSANAKRPAGDPKADKRRYFTLTHGSHLVDTTRFLCGEIVQVRARLLERFGSYSWFVDVEFANGALGHLDLTIPVCGDFDEGFQICGEHGSVKGQLYLPWFHKCSMVECFSREDEAFHRPLGKDAHTYKLQVEAFADTILHGVPQRAANIDDGVAAIRALVAIARSTESGAWVRLDQTSGSV